MPLSKIGKRALGRRRPYISKDKRRGAVYMLSVVDGVVTIKSCIYATHGARRLAPHYFSLHLV